MPGVLSSHALVVASEGFRLGSSKLNHVVIFRVVTAILAKHPSVLSVYLHPSGKTENLKNTEEVRWSSSMRLLWYAVQEA